MKLLTNLVLLSLLLVVTSATAQATEFKGRLEWLHEVKLRLLENGIVSKANVTVGQKVKKGDVLLQMDQREFKAKLSETEAVLAKAKVKLADAEREQERTIELYERGLIADEELKDAELKKAIATSEQASAEAANEIAKIKLERAALRAPFSAIVVQKNVWEGDVIYKTLQQDAPIVVAPSKQMLARVLVTADVLSQYSKGQAATISIRGKNYKGKIHSLGVESVRIGPDGAVYELDVIFNRPNKIILRQAEIIKVNLP